MTWHNCLRKEQNKIYKKSRIDIRYMPWDFSQKHLEVIAAWPQSNFMNYDDRIGKMVLMRRANRHSILAVTDFLGSLYVCFGWTFLKSKWIERKSHCPCVNLGESLRRYACKRSQLPVQLHWRILSCAQILTEIRRINRIFILISRYINTCLIKPVWPAKLCRVHYITECLIKVTKESSHLEYDYTE